MSPCSGERALIMENRVGGRRKDRYPEGHGSTTTGWALDSGFTSASFVPHDNTLRTVFHPHSPTEERKALRVYVTCYDLSYLCKY